MNTIIKLNNKKIQVLLSTYNGSKYLRQLIDSLLAQDYPNIDILVRDDGSLDNTMDILKKYELNRNISIIEGDHVGVPEGFFDLLRRSSSSSDFFAFCDQDDIWQSDKVTRAINLLKKLPENLPSMYCSRVLIVDHKLSKPKPSIIPKRGPSFKNALVENIATGCTVVINRAARNLLLLETPKHAIMHDAWAYLVISAFGTNIFDPEPKIWYRQHSSNAIGVKIGIIARWNARIQRNLKYGGLCLLTKNAIEFRRIFGESLPKDKREILDRFIEDRASLKDRIKYGLHSEVFRQSNLDNIILKILIILNRV